MDIDKELAREALYVKRAPHQKSRPREKSQFHDSMNH
jgi:hypothetical protein